jgi:hypothetical protein
VSLLAFVRCGHAGDQCVRRDALSAHVRRHKPSQAGGAGVASGKTVAVIMAFVRRPEPPSETGPCIHRGRGNGALRGVVGLVFVNRITTTVSSFVDVTTPLLIENVGLVDSAYRIRSTFLVAVERGDDLAPLWQQFSELDLQTEEHIRNLKALSAVAGVALQLDEIERHEAAYQATPGAITEASVRLRKSAAAIKERQVDFEAGRHRLQRVLVSLTQRAEGTLIKAEDEAKVEVQTRTATVDSLGDRLSAILNGTYPVVQNANELLREIDQIDESTHDLKQATVEQLPAIEEGFTRSFRTTASITRKLASRLGDAEGQAALATVRQSLEEIESTILGPAAWCKAGATRQRPRAISTPGGNCSTRSNAPISESSRT